MRCPQLLLVSLVVGCAAKTDTPVAGPVANGDAAARAACQYKAGAPAADTLDKGAPVGRSIPIDHFVLILQENRSFDHYFSKLTVPGQTIDVAPDDATNPAPGGAGVVKRFHQTEYCFEDTEHNWSHTHRQINDGAMDGFAVSNASSADSLGSRSLGYFDESDLPFYYGLARTFAISDRHFCSVPGPTYPNRFFYMAATSFGLTSNRLPPELDPEGNPYPNVMSAMSKAGVSWKSYSDVGPQAALFIGTYADNLGKFSPQEKFFEDAANGTLPSVSFFEMTNEDNGLNTDEHPPSNMQMGQAKVASVVKALMASPLWPRSAILFTYDEHGGLYDHVKPPPACPPDDLPKDVPAGTERPLFNTLGVRVPFIVVSPFAKRGHVSHVVTDHTSITRLLEARFDLPAMTGRDANAQAPFDMFDFDTRT